MDLKPANGLEDRRKMDLRIERASLVAVGQCALKQDELPIIRSIRQSTNQ